MKKRLVSLLLAFSMVLTFIPFNAVSAFAETGDFNVNGIEYRKIGDSNVIVCGYTGTPVNVKISDTVSNEGKTYYVSGIGYYSFAYCKSLKTVEISNYVMKIGPGAFNVCDNLESVKIPYNVNFIGYGAFKSCAKLKNVFFDGSESTWNGLSWQSSTAWDSKNFSSNYGLSNVENGVLTSSSTNYIYGNNVNNYNGTVNVVPWAGQTAKQYTLTLGTVPDEALEIPQHEGYTFTGWYKDATTQDDSTKVDFSKPITNNTTLYGGWHHDAELTTDIDSQKFVVGEPTEFTFSTVANGDAGEMVKGTSNFSDTDAIEKLEYYEVKDGNWYELKGDFGADTGFPMSDATSTFRATFKKAGTYTFTASMVKADDNSELCRKEVEFTVAPRTQTVNLTGDDVEVTVDGQPAEIVNGKVNVSVSDLDKGTEVTVTAKNTQYDDSYQWTKDNEVVENAAGAAYTFTVTDQDVDLALEITRHSYAEDDFDITIPTGLEEGDGLSHAVTITAKEDHDVGDFTWKYVAGDTVIEAPDAPEKAGSYKVYIVRDGKDIYAGTLVIGARRYELTVIDGTITLDGKEPENAIVSGNKMTASIPTGAIVTVTFDDSTLKDSGSNFDQWKITSKEDLLIPGTDTTVNPKNSTITFVMPKGGVEIEAMTKDATIEDDSSEALGIAAAVVTGAVGTAVLTYQGYMLGTELYLTYLLPAGAAIPANRAELAMLVWNDAGKPEPAAPVALDAADDVKALTWAVETGLMDETDKNGEALAADASVSRIEVIKTWKKAQELKNN